MQASFLMGSEVDFLDVFSYTDGTDLATVNGWGTQGSGSAIATNGSARLVDVTLTNSFTDGETDLWSDIEIQAILGDDNTTNPPAGSSYAFYVNGDGNVVVYDGTNTLVVGGTSIPATGMTRFTVRSHYHSRTWDLYVDSVMVTNGLGFFDTNTTAFTEFGIHSGGGLSGADTTLVDRVEFTTTAPAFGIPEVAFERSADAYDEGIGTATANVVLAWAYTNAVQVTVVDLGTGDAEGAGTDYSFASTTLTFNAGVTTQSFTFTVVDDSVAEPSETIAFGLTNLVGCLSGLQNTFVATIEPDVNDLSEISFLSDAVSIQESAGVVTVQVELSAPVSSGSVSVAYSLTAATATADSDYTNYSDGFLTFPAGVATNSFSFEVLDDMETDGAETLQFGLHTLDNCKAGSYTQIVYTIEEDLADYPPQIAFANSSLGVAEGTASLTPEVRLSAPYNGTVTVTVADLGTGDATVTDDYSLADLSLTFSPGDTSKTFTVSIVDDTIGEPAETIELQLSSIVNATPAAPTNLTISISGNGNDIWAMPFLETFDDRALGDWNGQNGWAGVDAVVQDSVTYTNSPKAGGITSATGSVSHVFGDNQTNVWTDFVIQPVFGDTSTSNPPADSTFAFYVNTTGSVVIYNGTSMETTTTTVVEHEWARFTVNSDYAHATWDLYVDEQLVQADIGFYQTNTASYTEFGLVSGGGASNAPVDNIDIRIDRPAFALPEVSFEHSAFSYAESVGTATGNVVLAWAYTNAVQVTVVDLGTGDAGGAGTDYSFASTTLTFNAGVTTQSFTFTVVDDSVAEPNETIVFGLTGIIGGLAGARDAFTATIEPDVNDDLEVSFAAGTASITEDAGVVTVEVALSAPASGTLSVDYTLTAATATADADYTNYSNGTFTFELTEQTKSFTFEVIDDLVAEGVETLQFGLSGFTNCRAGTYTQIVYSIEADIGDVQPTVSFLSGTAGVLEGGSLTPSVRLSKSYNGTVTVDVTDLGTGDAETPADYTLSGTSLLFAPGETNKTFTVVIVQDSDGEEAETILLQLDNVTGATPTGTTNMTITIAEDPNDWTIPYYQTFETLDAAPLNGQFGWVAVDADVQAGIGSGGSQAATITSETGYISHSFAGGRTNVWTDLVIKPVFAEAGSTTVTDVPAGSSFAFYVGTNGLVQAYDGNSVVTQLTHTALVEGEWARFTVNSDYGTRQWSIYVDGVLAGEGIDYYDETAAGYTEFGVIGAGASTAPVDDLAITLETPNVVPPEVSFSAEGDSYAEGIGVATGYVSLAWDYFQDVEVTIVDLGTGTADPASDYGFASTTLTFHAGVTSLPFTFVVTNDLVGEPDETILFGFGALVNAVAGAQTNFTATILEDVTDVPAVSFSVADGGTLEEGDDVTVVVTLNAVYASGTASADYAISLSGTATGADVTNYAAGTLLFPAGQTETNFTFTVLDDVLEEGAETLVFELSNVNNCVAGTPIQTTYTIAVDERDGAPFANFATASTIANEGDVGLSVAVELSWPYYTRTVDVSYAFSAGTAVADDIANTAPASLVFQPGETNKVFTFDVVDDTLGELNESFSFVLSGYSNAAAGIQTTHTVTILSDPDDAFGLPFTETFDALAPGDWNGQNGWTAQDAVVQTTATRLGSAAAGSITSQTAHAYHQFSDAQTLVWVDMYIQPVLDGGATTNPPAGSSYAFYVNASSNVVVYNGTQTNTLSDVVVTPGDWTRFAVRCDYTTRRWELYVNRMTSPVAAGLRFYDETVSAFSEFGVISGHDADPVELDDIRITLDPPIEWGRGTMFRFQ